MALRKCSKRKAHIRDALDSEGASNSFRRRRQLLRHAVKCAESEHEIAAVNSDDLAIGKKFGQRVQCDAIIRIVEYGHEDSFVGDVEVCVTRRQPLRIETNW